MNQHQQLFYYPPHLMVESADFDGTNDYMTRGAGLTGAADSKSGIMSFWLRLDGTLSASQYSVLISSTFKFQVYRSITSDGNTISIQCRNSSGTLILWLVTSVAYTNSATWHHFLISWDLASSASNFYADDVDVQTVNTITDDTIDYTDSDWIAGASSTIGANKMDGCLAELYFAPGQYLDFSTTSNRRRFITSSGKPVYLGTDGAGPTGTAPIVYFHLDPSEALANFATNRGTGGDFSITGTLTAGSSSPSDF